jgi:hypothetical protein
MVKTITLHLEMPNDRMLHIPLPSDIPDGPLEVVLVIASEAVHPQTPPLAGRWQTYFPPDFDIDDALHELRHEWEKEWLKDE